MGPAHTPALATSKDMTIYFIEVDIFGGVIKLEVGRFGSE